MDDFAKLQAILAGLPMHAVPTEQMRACGAFPHCAGHRKPEPALDGASCRERIQRRLQEKVCFEFPTHRHLLLRLEVVHASLDLTILRDQEEEKLYVAARGTDFRSGINPWTTPRDLSNDLQIFVGVSPGRAVQVAKDYQLVRRRFPKYKVYGSGHSLGGNVIQHLAESMEDDETYRFSRIDIFNSGASPLRPSAVSSRGHTDVYVHKVAGDWVSRYHLETTPKPSSVILTTYQPKKHLGDRHALGHFLPEPASDEEAPALVLSSRSAPAIGSASASSSCQELAAKAQTSANFTVQRDLRSWLLTTFGAFSCLGPRKQPPMLTQQKVRANVLRPPQPTLVADDALQGGLLPEEVRAVESAKDQEPTAGAEDEPSISTLSSDQEDHFLRFEAGIECTDLRSRSMPVIA
mmetsp:Transcript_21934/g.51285  ORF Transcript_21934/g.51285 Transcript_21934/m.51285 type:complete len:407 (-) Transcript_21934:99-1319(-)